MRCRWGVNPCHYRAMAVVSVCPGTQHISHVSWSHQDRMVCFLINSFSRASSLQKLKARLVNYIMVDWPTATIKISNNSCKPVQGLDGSGEKEVLGESMGREYSILVAVVMSRNTRATTSSTHITFCPLHMSQQFGLTVHFTKTDWHPLQCVKIWNFNKLNNS